MSHWKLYGVCCNCGGPLEDEMPCNACGDCHPRYCSDPDSHKKETH